MRKGFLVMLAVVLVAALAAPAMAVTDINGFYRAKSYVSNFKPNGTVFKDAPTNAYVEQRVRLKIASGEENVKGVAFFELDQNWGDSAYAVGRNQGGAIGGDSINIELKNAYLWFKLPNTSVDVTVGLQGVNDPYGGVFLFYGDMAGIFVNGKFDPVSYRLGWSKWYEKATAKTDDTTFYLAEVKFAPSKDVKVGANFYVIQDDRNRAGASASPAQFYVEDDGEGGLILGDQAVAAVAAVPASTSRIYMPGVDVTFGAGPAKINAFAFYQFGKFTDFKDSASSDIDITGFAADVRADLTLGPGKLFAEAIYISGGDNNANKYKSIVTGNNYGSGMGLYGRTDMQILLPNTDDINTSNALVGAATNGLGNGGRGLMHVAVGYSQKLGDKLTGKVGAGYLQATKLAAGHFSGQDKAMGTEVNASVNYNLMKGLDVGVVGAYAFIGDFFKTSSTSDPDDAFDLHARINYAF